MITVAAARGRLVIVGIARLSFLGCAGLRALLHDRQEGGDVLLAPRGQIVRQAGPLLPGAHGGSPG